MPVHNAAKYIRQSVMSVLAQSYPYLELIVVDDASTDESMEIVSGIEDERIVKLTNTGRHSAADARNLGIDAARGRYIAYLDADDLWNEKKLERSLHFMWRENAAFICTAYEFGDEDAKGSGKIVHVPESMNLKQAYTRTVIFTSTVLLDISKLGRETVKMPYIESEDTACWWNILRTGICVRGLDENLTTYRRPRASLSSNKAVALRRIWQLYRRHEKLNVFYSALCFAGWAVRATLRRI